MCQATNRHGRRKTQQSRPAGTDGQPAEPLAIDQERLIWDPEYRREIARLLRQTPPERS